MGLNGGNHQQSLPILIPLKISGMNLKYIRREVKPKNKADLLDGIRKFWGTVSMHKCQKYIGHLKKVIPKVIEFQGDASGYYGFASPTCVYLHYVPMYVHVAIFNANLIKRILIGTYVPCKLDNNILN